MERHEREHVEANLSTLIEYTSCDLSLLAAFFSGRYLTQEETEKIRAEPGNIAKARKFYDIIVTKPGSYPFLVKALGEACQSGAVAVLENLPTPSGTSSSSSSSSTREPVTGNQAVDSQRGTGTTTTPKSDKLRWERATPK